MKKVTLRDLQKTISASRGTIPAFGRQLTGTQIAGPVKVIRGFAKK